MHRGILAYVIILVILILVAYYFYTSSGGVNPPTTTSTISRSGGSTTTIAEVNGTSSTTTATTTTVYYASCISTSSTVALPNGNFSTGTYANWTATGPGFGSGPLNLTEANTEGSYYAAPWSGYDGNFFATSYATGVSLQAGNLTSQQFEVSELYLNFRIISSQNSLLYVQILKGGVPVITAHYNTYVSPKGVDNPQSTFVNASIPLGTLLCQNVSVKLVAGVTGKSSAGSGYIAAGDFYLGKTPPKNVTQPVNQTILS